MGLFIQSVEFVVRVVSQLARTEGERVLRTENEYIFCDLCIDFRGF